MALAWPPPCAEAAACSLRSGRAAGVSAPSSGSELAPAHPMAARSRDVSAARGGDAPERWRWQRPGGSGRRPGSEPAEQRVKDTNEGRSAQSVGFCSSSNKEEGRTWQSSCGLPHRSESGRGSLGAGTAALRSKTGERGVSLGAAQARMHCLAGGRILTATACAAALAAAVAAPPPCTRQQQQQQQIGGFT